MGGILSSQKLNDQSTMKIGKDLLLEFNEVKASIGLTIGEKVNVEKALHILLHVYKQAMFPVIAAPVVEDMEQCDVRT